MAMRQLYNEIRGLKLRDVPGYLRERLSANYFKQTIQRGLDSCYAKYIQTSSPDPLFHVCQGVMLISYFLALPEERRHLQHKEHGAAALVVVVTDHYSMDWTGVYVFE